MFTVFDLFQLLFPFFGFVTGAVLGARHFGWFGGVAGAIVGFAIGIFAGRLPFLIAWKVTNFEGKSTKKLWQFIHEDQYFIFHIVFPLLMARGEDVTSEKSRILDLMLSDNGDRRRFGWASLQIVFPLIAKQFAEFDPENPSQEHLEELNVLRKEAE